MNRRTIENLTRTHRTEGSVFSFFAIMPDKQQYISKLFCADKLDALKAMEMEARLRNAFIESIFLKESEKVRVS